MTEQATKAVATVAILGCGGCGINLARQVGKDCGISPIYFDTSDTNIIGDETVNIIGNGLGSGGYRKENARAIEAAMPQYDFDKLIDADVYIVISSAAGGSGSVISPLMSRELLRRRKNVIVALVADETYGVGAENTMGTLKSFTAICDKNDFHLPMVVGRNLIGRKRSYCDDMVTHIVDNLIFMLTEPVMEIDLKDRLHFIDPSKLIKSTPGIKLITALSEQTSLDPEVVVGINSKEVVDSMLVIQKSKDDDLSIELAHHVARNKKVGYMNRSEIGRGFVARVTSDISDIDRIIDSIEHMTTTTNNAKHAKIGRLALSDDDDVIGG